MRRHFMLVFRVFMTYLCGYDRVYEYSTDKNNQNKSFG